MRVTERCNTDQPRPKCWGRDGDGAGTQNGVETKRGVELSDGEHLVKERFSVNTHVEAPMLNHCMFGTEGEMVRYLPEWGVCHFHTGGVTPVGGNVSMVDDSPAVKWVPQVFTSIGISNLRDGGMGGGDAGMGDQPYLKLETLHRAECVNDTIMIEIKVRSNVPGR